MSKLVGRKKALRRLDARIRGFQETLSRSRDGKGYTQPGSMKK